MQMVSQEWAIEGADSQSVLIHDLESNIRRLMAFPVPALRTPILIELTNKGIRCMFEAREIHYLQSLLDELAFLDSGLPDSLVDSLALQMAFALETFSTVIDITTATAALTIDPSHICITEQGTVLLDAVPCLVEWQQKHSAAASAQDPFTEGDPNTWLRANLQEVVQLMSRLRLADGGHLTNVIVTLSEKSLINLSSMLNDTSIFHLFNMLFNKLGIKTGMGQTPLMILIKYYGEALASPAALVPYASQYCMQDYCGQTALMYAVSHCSRLCPTLAVKEARIADSNGCTALMRAATVGNEAALQALIPYEAACTTPYGHTALMYAAANHRYKCALELIPYESEMASNKLDMIYGEGFTALMAAADAGAADIVTALLPHEAWMRQKPSEEYPYGKGPYDYASARNRTICANIISLYTVKSHAETI